MRPTFTIAAVAVLLVVAPSRCFALWDVVTVSKEHAKELGMEVRSKAAGPNHVQVVLEFNAEGKLKHFTHISMSLGKGDNLVVSATLREDRSKPGLVAVSLRADHAQLDKLTFTVSVPFRDGGLGGTHYEIRVKDFVELKKAG
jgi:hypothetical protein